MLQKQETSPTHASLHEVSVLKRLITAIRDLSMARDLDTVKTVTSRAARDLTGADGATFVLKDNDKCYYLEEDAIAPLWKGQKFPLEDCISGWVMLNKKVAVIEDIYQDERIPKDVYQTTFVKSLVMVPVRQSSPIAAIGNYWSDTRRPTPEEIDVLQSLADATSIALENVRLYSELTRAEQAEAESRQRYQLLYEWEKKTRQVLEKVRQTLEIEDVFAILVHEISRTLQTDRCFIVEFDAAGHVLPVRYESSNLAIMAPFAGTVPPWDFSPFIVACQKNQTAYSADAWNDTQFIQNEKWFGFSRRYHIRGIAAVPIMYEGKLQNVLVLHTAEPRHWTEQELFLLKIVTEQVSTLFYQAKVKEQIKKTSDAKSQFISTLHHELRTPLNAIIGYGEMLESGIAGDLTEKQKRYASNMVTSGRYLLDMVNEILDLAKIESGKAVISMEPLLLEQVMTEKQSTFEPLAAQKRVSLVFEIEPGLNQVTTDPLRLKQILLNLLSNAIKFNREGGQVTVRWHKTPDAQWAVCQVEDTGCGIPADKMPELFTEFYQVDNSFSRRYDGTGLGLAVTKRLVELLGGSISVESREGVGSTFSFTLPLSRE